MLAASLFAVASSAGASAPRSACQRLHGSDLAPARSIKLIDRSTGPGVGELTACTLPRGRLKSLASRVRSDGYPERFTVLAVAGRWLALSTSQSDKYYGSSTEQRLVDLRSGVRRPFEILSDPAGPITSATLARAAVTPSGRAAFAVVESRADGTQATSIQALDVQGDTVLLDRALSTAVPPTSLSIQNGLVMWTHDGVPRAARLSDLQPTPG